MRLCSIIFFVCVCVGRSAYAIDQPAYCFGYKYIQFVNLSDYLSEERRESLPVKKYTCEDFNSFDDLGGEINNLVKLTNPGIDIIVIPDVRGSHDTYAFDHLGIAFERNSPEDIQFVKPVFVHEWSHALLNRYLQDNLSFYEPYRKIRDESERESILMFKFISLAEQDGTCKSKTCLEFVNANKAALESSFNSNLDQQINDFFENVEGSEVMLMVSGHYHELFADFVAAVYYSDSDVIKKSLQHFFSEENIIHFDCRSMTFAAPVGFSETEPHCSLSAVRPLLWNKALKADTASKKQRLISDFLKVLANQIIKQFDRTVAWPAEKISLFPDEEAKSDLAAAIQNI